MYYKNFSHFWQYLVAVLIFVLGLAFVIAGKV